MHRAGLGAARAHQPGSGTQTSTGWKDEHDRQSAR